MIQFKLKKITSNLQIHLHRWLPLHLSFLMESERLFRLQGVCWRLLSASRLIRSCMWWLLLHKCLFLSSPLSLSFFTCSTTSFARHYFSQMTFTFHHIVQLKVFIVCENYRYRSLGFWWLWKEFYYVSFTQVVRFLLLFYNCFQTGFHFLWCSSLLPNKQWTFRCFQSRWHHSNGLPNCLLQAKWSESLHIRICFHQTIFAW